MYKCLLKARKRSDSAAILSFLKNIPQLTALKGILLPRANIPVHIHASTFLYISFALSYMGAEMGAPAPLVSYLASFFFFF